MRRVERFKQQSPNPCGGRLVVKVFDRTVPSWLEADRSADDLGWEALTVVAGSLVFHAAQSAKPELN